MSNIDDNVVPVLYALMALEQDITTSELAVGAQNRSMPEADTETPEWFAAAPNPSMSWRWRQSCAKSREDVRCGGIWTSSASTHRRCRRSANPARPMPTTDPASTVDDG